MVQCMANIPWPFSQSKRWNCIIIDHVLNNTHLEIFIYHFSPFFCYSPSLEETVESIDHGSRALVHRIYDQAVPVQRSRVVAHASGAGHGLHAVC